MENPPSSTAVLDPVDLEEALRQQQAQQDQLVQQNQLPQPSSRPLTSDERKWNEEVTNPPSEPLPNEVNKGLQIQVVDMSSAIPANDYAADKLDRKTQEGGRFKRFINKIWYGNIAKDYYNLKYQKEGRDQIVGQELQERNVYLLQGGTKQDHDNAAKAVVERFVGDYLHSGESQNDLAEARPGADPEKPETPAEHLQYSLKRLVSEYASGTIADIKVVEEAKKRFLADYGKSLGETDRNKGLVFADNIVEVAKNAKAAAEHFGGVKRIEEALSVKSGEARMGVRTEAKLSVADRVLEKVYSKKIGAGLNETTLIGLVGVAAVVTNFTFKKTAQVAGATIGLGVGAAVIAGARENLHIKQDRRNHGRDMAKGGGNSLIHSGKRRMALEATRYETVAAKTLTENIGASMALLSEGAAGLRSTVDSVLWAKARIGVSDLSDVDLIHFSSETSVETERTMLDMKIAEARAAIHKILMSADDETLDRAGLTYKDRNNQVQRIRDVDALFEGRVGAVVRELKNGEGGMSAKDRVFQGLQAKQVAKAASLAFVTGLIAGVGIQEIKAEYNDGLQGIFESQDGGDNRRTLLAGLFRGDGVAATPGVENVIPLSPNHDLSPVIGGNAQVEIPEGYHLSQEANGQWSLADVDNNVIDGNVSFDPTGHLDPTTLQGKGFGITEHANTLTDPDTVTTTEVTRTPEEYIANHQDQFTKVSRGEWFDNDTAKPDHNEKDIWWGGENGKGVDANGNYVFDVSHMTAEGSWHDGTTANAQQLIHDGKMSIALSIGEGTQHQVVMVQVNEQGQAIISKDSFMAKNLFQTGPDGHAQFIGKYAEAVQVTGEHDGAQTMNIFGTVVGEGRVDTLTDTVTTTTPNAHTLVTTTLEAPIKTELVGATEALDALPVEIPPVIPIYGRAGLENVPRKRTPEQISLNNPNLAPSYYGGSNLEELRKWINADPTRLHTRREITNADGTTSWFEENGEPVVRSVERERSMLTAYLEKQKADNPTHYQMVEQTANFMGPMREETRVSVNVPAWMEEKNLTHFLEEYTAQVDTNGELLSPETYEINVLINRKTGTPADNSVRVIQKFLDDFENEKGFRPSVNYCDVEFDPPYNNVGYARKLLTDAVALRSVNRTNQSKPLYIETEDADMVNVDKKTVINLINKLDKNPQLDAVRGVQDRAPEYLKNNDFLFIRRRAWDFFEIMSRSKSFRNPSEPGWSFTWNRVVTGGWNSGYTAESYAMIGGYDVVEAGEDMSVGEKITMARGDGRVPNLEVVGTVSSRSDSSPRRFIHEILTDEPAYADFSNEEANTRMREQSIDDFMETIKSFDRINATNEKDFAAYVNNTFGWAKSATPSTTDAVAMTKRLMLFLGFKKDDYDIDVEHDAVNVHTWDNVKDALDKYRQRSSKTV